jgi:hypothetical protein
MEGLIVLGFLAGLSDYFYVRGKRVGSRKATTPADLTAAEREDAVDVVASARSANKLTGIARRRFLSVKRAQ